LLRLPSGLFYAQGVKSNGIFFDKPRNLKVDPPAERIWIYYLRSDKRFSLKTKPLQREDLQEFVALFRAGFQSDTQVAGAQAAARLRSFGTAQILSTPDCRLDLAWDDPSIQQRTPGLARLEEISRLVAEDLQRALALISKPPAG
jgi:type I restriction enzyme M protein